MCNGCAGKAAHNVSIALAPAAPLPCLGLQDRLPAAPAQLPAQQPARRGPAQHRPVIGGIGKNIVLSGKADASQPFHGKVCNLCGKVCMNEAACSHLTHGMLYAYSIRRPWVAAEALVPAHALSSEIALRQRLMAQLNGAQGAAAPRAALLELSQAYHGQQHATCNTGLVHEVCVCCCRGTGASASIIRRECPAAAPDDAAEQCARRARTCGRPCLGAAGSFLGNSSLPGPFAHAHSGSHPAAAHSFRACTQDCSHCCTW